MKYLAFALTVVALTGAGCTQQEEVPKPASDDGIETSVPAKPQSV
jgi:hypothetical protein